MIKRIVIGHSLLRALPGILAWLVCFANTNLGWPMLFLGLSFGIFQCPFVKIQGYRIFRWLFANSLGWFLGVMSAGLIWGNYSACRIIDSSLVFYSMGSTGLLGGFGLALGQYWCHWHHTVSSRNNLLRLLFGYGIGGLLAFELMALDVFLIVSHSIRHEYLFLLFSCLIFGFMTAIAVQPLLNSIGSGEEKYSV